ncbi:hypothetical protein SBF1_9490002 [Candidatus Desulfosporosinus infrequens]|uniref:Uncharacterized protein n=1 Tax=Candidatus Desulfosporosinus infrequens TaxID=2043169 RepID=A0A2U3LXQ2_9FIRM|nr:hypothetical protein SBF1_9490002 [Candidatus Desulfosporosinus infrequens]
MCHYIKNPLDYLGAKLTIICGFQYFLGYTNREGTEVNAKERRK